MKLKRALQEKGYQLFEDYHTNQQFVVLEKISAMEIYVSDTFDSYNRFFGFETRHPLVGVVHFSGERIVNPYAMSFGFYSLFLKNTRGC